MKTAVFTDVKSIKIEEVPMPTVTPNKILIKVDACAICTWEQRVYTGVKQVDFPFIGGHEIAGHIIEVGSDISSENWVVGDKVVYGTNLACGDCYYCKKSQEQNCLNFDHSKHLEGLPYKGMGGFSEYMLVDPKHIFKFDHVSPIEASMTEPLSCVIHSVESAKVELADTVVVIGCGIMGQLHIQLAKLKGARVIASDLNENRLQLAKQNGASYVINPAVTNLYDKVMELTSNIGAQVIFDTTPISSVAEDAVKLLSPLGRLVLYSSFYPDKSISISPDTLHKKAFSILGTANSNSSDFVDATRLIEMNIIQLDQYVSEVYPFHEIEKALESAIQGDKYRVILDFNR